VPHALLLMARTVRDGRFEPGVRFFGSETASWTSRTTRRWQLGVPEALRRRIAAARDSIIAGTLQVPRVEFVGDSVPRRKACAMRLDELVRHLDAYLRVHDVRMIRRP